MQLTDNSNEEQRQQLVNRLKRIQEDYQRCTSDVSTEVANRGTEWSIVDLLRHTTGGYYPRMLTRLLEEDNPDLGGGGFDPDAGWKTVVDGILSDIDGAINSASVLTTEQLGRSGQRMGQSLGVLDVITLMANHYDEHLAQLRDEIRPREDLPRT